MKVLRQIGRFFARFRHPLSLPEDIAIDLGIRLPNRFSFEHCISTLANPNCAPSKLKKYMDREEADESFVFARRQERFPRRSLYSYYIGRKWIEISLVYDKDSRLRRVYFQYEGNPNDQSIEILLHEAPLPVETT